MSEITVANLLADSEIFVFFVPACELKGEPFETSPRMSLSRVWRPPKKAKAGS